jgi:tRNA nucleotidyltransferase (CCA-adding enzyme)
MSADGSDRESILEGVLEDVSPSDEERDELREAYEEVRERALEALDEEGVEGDVTLVGSAARDTWLSGDRDIDVFLVLPPGLDREEFERVGLEVGKTVFPDGNVEYAEHPYAQGEKEGYEVDIVPCYDIESTDELRSAVDRTPFHNEYVKGAGIDGDEVRLLKAFARGAGVYGSDLRTRGFSGYLCELLVLHYGGFSSVVEAGADWDEGTVIDVEGHGREEFDDPLVVIDPTDPDRNVAAVLSLDSFASFIDRCRRWEREPGEDLFYPEEPEPMDADGLAEVVEKRGTELVCLSFDSPDVVDDQLYPQLEKTKRSLVEELERRGFDVLRSAVAADGSCLITVEMNVAEQSRTEKHFGPPVSVRKHAESFRKKYEDEDVVGPYIEDGRYVVEREREHPTAVSFVESDDVFDLSIGKHVEESMERGYEVRTDEDCAALLGEFGVEFARYFGGG